jgi:hypothetical protein
MSRLSGHLSQVGALVVAVVAAAVAYSVYDAGSTTSNTDAREPVAGLLPDSGNGLLPDSHRQQAERVREPNGGRTAGPRSAGAVRSSWPAPGPQGQLNEPLLQNVSAPLAPASAPLGHGSAPLLSRPLPIGVPRARDDHGRRRAGNNDRGPWRPGPFDRRAVDRELQRLIGDKPLPRVPRGPAEDFPTDLPPELIKGPGTPAPKPAPESPNVPAQPAPTPVVAPPASPTPTTPAASEPSESTPDEAADSDGSEEDADVTDTGTTTPPPPPAEPAPAPANPDDQTGNADDEDAGIDDQSGEAEDESPVPPGGSEGADDGLAGDGDDAVAPPPVPSAPAVVDMEGDSGAGAPPPAAPADQVEPQPVDAGLAATGPS